MSAGRGDEDFVDDVFDDVFDDATRLSARRAAHDEDATRLASRRSGGPDAADDGDEATRLASRRAVSPDAVGEGDDATRLASRRTQPPPDVSMAGDDTGPSASVEETTRAAGRGDRSRRRPMLPPGAPATDLPRQGDFGAEHERYETRATPVVTPSAPPSTASGVSSEAVHAVLTPDEVAAKRERARRRRLVGIAIAVAAGAALVTAVAVVALTVLQGAA